MPCSLLCPLTPIHDTRLFEDPLAGDPGPIGAGLCALSRTFPSRNGHPAYNDSAFGDAPIPSGLLRWRCYVTRRGRRAPPSGRRRPMATQTTGSSLDELAKGLATGTLSRGKAIRLVGSHLSPFLVCRSWERSISCTARFLHSCRGFLLGKPGLLRLVFGTKPLEGGCY
jgi:hypothetical protein